MVNNKYNSTISSIENDLIEFQRFELQVMSLDRIKDLEPTIVSMKAVQIILEMLIEISDHIKTKGKSEKAEKSRVRLLSLFDYINSLNNLTGDLNTLKLNIKSAYSNYSLILTENKELKQQLKNIQDAEQY